MIQPRPTNHKPDPPPLHNLVEDSLLTNIGPLPSGFPTTKSQPVLTQYCNHAQVHTSAHSATQKNFQHPSNQTFFSTGHTNRVTPFPLPRSPQQTQSPAATARATFPPNQASSATWHPRIRLAYAAPHTSPPLHHSASSLSTRNPANHLQHPRNAEGEKEEERDNTNHVRIAIERNGRRGHDVPFGQQAAARMSPTRCCAA